MLDFQLNAQKINKNLPIPFYYQIVQILREAIEDHGIASDPDQGEVALPSETELCEFFQVNRGTVRHALEMLEREGLIYREKGRGTFLRRRRVELDLASLCSTTEDLRARGWAPQTRVLSIARMAPGLHIQRHLQLAEGSPVWQVYRLRLANGEPISLQWSYIPAHLAPDLDQRDLTGSLYYTLKNIYGIDLKTADQTIRTRAVILDESELLEIAEGDPVFDITRVTYDQHQRPVEYLDSLWRGDRYDLRVRLYSREQGCG